LQVSTFETSFERLKEAKGAGYFIGKNGCCERAAKNCRRIEI